MNSFVDLYNFVSLLSFFHLLFYLVIFIFNILRCVHIVIYISFYNIIYFNLYIFSCVFSSHWRSQHLQIELVKWNFSGNTARVIKFVTSPALLLFFLVPVFLFRAMQLSILDAKAEYMH